MNEKTQNEKTQNEKNINEKPINTKLFQPSVWDDFPMKRNNQLIDTVIQPEFELDLPERIKLPKGFQIVQLSLESHLERIREFLNNYYFSDYFSDTNPDTKTPINTSIVYSAEYIEWLFTCPKKQFKKFKTSMNDNWLVGVEDINSGELYGFISARPVQYFIDERYCNAMMIDKMCVKSDARSKRLSVVLMKEIYRRMKHIENECMALFCTNAHLPFQPIAAHSSLLSRPLSFNCINNRNKTNDTSSMNELIARRDQETDTTVIKDLNNQIASHMNNSIESIVATPDIHQIRLANKRDIDELMEIYNKYNRTATGQKNYRLHRCYNKKEFEHVFLPRRDMIYTYVLTNSQGSIKDFVSVHIFYTNQGQKLAFIYYISFINDKLLEIFMKNILYILKQSEVDQVIAHEWSGLTSTLKELNFQPWDSSPLTYAWYIFNYNTKTISIDECNINVFL